MKPRIYIETTVLSYLAARPSRDVVTVSRQKLSHDFWDWAPTVYALCSSDLVRDEISKGDLAAAARRASYFEQCQIVPQDRRVVTLAQQLVDTKAVPSTEPEDAAHIATATLANMKYIVSWNFSHMVSPQAKRQLERAITELGYPPPLLATPEEIFEAEST